MSCQLRKKDSSPASPGHCLGLPSCLPHCPPLSQKVTFSQFLLLLRRPRPLGKSCHPSGCHHSGLFTHSLRSSPSLVGGFITWLSCGHKHGWSLQEGTQPHPLGSSQRRFCREKDTCTRVLKEKYKFAMGRKTRRHAMYAADHC